MTRCTPCWIVRAAPPAGGKSLTLVCLVDINFWGQLHSSLLLSSTLLVPPPPPPPPDCHVLFVFSSEHKPTRRCWCWGDSLAQQEQRAASCLQCVTPPSLLLFLPHSSIYNFPLSYICLTQLSRELFVTKKAFTLDFCLLLIIFDRTTQYRNAFVFPFGHFDECKKGNLIIRIYFFPFVRCAKYSILKWTCGAVLHRSSSLSVHCCPSLHQRCFTKPPYVRFRRKM